jgi:hypothetical protein
MDGLAQAGEPRGCCPPAEFREPETRALPCVRRTRVIKCKRKINREFLQRCFRADRRAAVDRKTWLSMMMQTYRSILRQVFRSWHDFTSCEVLRKCSLKFILERSKLMRKSASSVDVIVSTTDRKRKTSTQLDGNEGISRAHRTAATAEGNLA